MKYFKLNNRVLLFFAAVLFLGISSCKKVKVFDPLGDGGPKMIGFINGGPEGFAASSLAFVPTLSSALVEVRVLYTGAGVFDNDVTLTIASDAAALTAYNAKVPAGGIIYTMAPASGPAAIYSLPSTTVLLKKGNTMSEPFTIDFKPNMLDLAISYMLPLSITAIAGAPGDVTKAPGTGTIFLHIIGNPLAGNYDVEGHFYHPSVPRAFTRTGAAGFLTPVSDKALYSELGDLGTSGYYAIFSVPDPFATTIQNVTVSVYPGSISPVYQWDAGLPTTGVPIYAPVPAPTWGKSGQCNNTYNPATKTWYMRYGYLGGTGWRVTEEIIKKV